MPYCDFQGVRLTSKKPARFLHSKQGYAYRGSYILRPTIHFTFIPIDSNGASAQPKPAYLFREDETYPSVNGIKVAINDMQPIPNPFNPNYLSTKDIHNNVCNDNIAQPKTNLPGSRIQHPNSVKQAKKKPSR